MTSFIQAIEGGDKMVTFLKQERTENLDVVIFLTDGIPTIDFALAWMWGDKLKNNSDTVYGVTYPERTNPYLEYVSDKILGGDSIEDIYADILNDLKKDGEPETSTVTVKKHKIDGLKLENITESNPIILSINGTKHEYKSSALAVASGYFEEQEEGTEKYLVLNLEKLENEERGADIKITY